MKVFENVLEILSIMFGGSTHSRIVKSGETATGRITTFQARTDGTTLTALTNHKDADVLSETLNGETLYAMEWFTNGKDGFRSLTVSVGSVKIDGSSLNVS